MGFGESRFDVHPRLQQAIRSHADKKSYLPARGLPQLVESVATYYSHKLAIDFKQSQVVIGPGSKALIYALQMILDADVFLPTPSWVSYGPQAALLSKPYFYIPSKVEDNYQLNILELDKLVKRSQNPCKLLIINSPNNPSGEVWPSSLLEELADYCRANNIWVLSDEIYFEICYGETKHVSIASLYPEGTFVLGGLSKHLSIGGWRVGVALLPDNEFGRQLVEKMVLFASETWSSVSAPIQYAALVAYSLDHEIEQYVADCRAIHGIRTRFFKAGIEQLGIRCSGGQGAFYITANFDHWQKSLSRLDIDSSAQLSQYLLEHFNLATLPGSDFGIPEKQQSLRLSTSYLDMETEFDSRRIFDLYKSQIGSTRLMSAKHHPNTDAALKAFADFVGLLVGSIDEPRDNSNSNLEGLK